MSGKNLQNLGEKWGQKKGTKILSEIRSHFGRLRNPKKPAQMSRNWLKSANIG
jgi:hypothetical protein